MHHSIKILLASLITLSTTVAHAGFNGSIAFTAEERDAHAAALPTILQTAAGCLESDLKRQQDFFGAHGIAAFYGDRSAFSRLSDADKRATISRAGRDPNLVKQLQPTSCVGMTMKCLGRGFTAAGADQAALWKRLATYTNSNGVDGLALQDGLQKLGWRILYWNPNVKDSAAYDRAEAASHPRNTDHFWGEHLANWNAVRTRAKYLYNHVDDATTLINFGDREPDALRAIPFFVGTAHMGYHVFPGTRGEVIEAHSTRAITDPKTVQSAPFNPLAGEAPTDGEYRSGLIAVPPGY